MKRYQLRYLFTYYAAVVALLAVVLALTTKYFSVPVPLAFFIKAVHAYKGYQPYLDALAYMDDALFICLPVILFGVLLFQKRHGRIVLAYAAPVAAVFAYLLTVEQIMGYRGRYYFPFCSLLVLAFLHVASDQVNGQAPRFEFKRGLVFALTLICCTPLSLPFSRAIAEWAVVRHRVFLTPEFHTSASMPLEGRAYFANLFAFIDTVKGFPKGSRVALSEVGFAGALLPRYELIDTAGLNDTDLATKGFDVSKVYERHPDIIWLLNPEYSQLAGRFATDPHLLQEYEVYAQVFGYGVAIRKAGPGSAAIHNVLERRFAEVYGTRLRLDEYRVSAITWDPDATRPGTFVDVQHF